MKSPTTRARATQEDLLYCPMAQSSDWCRTVSIACADVQWPTQKSRNFPLGLLNTQGISQQ